MFAALRRAGGTAVSNMAVGYNNVDVNAANKYGVAVGNTPVSLLFHIVADNFALSSYILHLNRLV